MTRCDGEPLRLRVRDLVVDVGGRSLIDRVSFDIAAGEIVALTGPNGAGKTTLLRALTGLVACRGARLIDGVPVEADVLPSGVGACIGAPAVIEWMHPLSFGQMLVESTGTCGSRGHVERVLREVGLEEDLWKRRFKRLSQGQRATALLACALLDRPTLLLLDEPFAHLDLARAEALDRLIERLAIAGCAVLYSCHRAGDLRVAQRAIGIDQGRLRGSWAPSDPAVLAWVR